MQQKLPVTAEAVLSRSREHWTVMHRNFRYASMKPISDCKQTAVNSIHTEGSL